VADIATYAELGTAAGTLVLAVATFGAVRSSNRAARVAERSLLIGLRPILIPSREGSDPAETVGFGGGHQVFHVPAGSAVAEERDGQIYFVIALRNVGAGVAVLHGWAFVDPERRFDGEPSDPAAFRAQIRDLYVPPSDTGFWQARLRDADDLLWAPVSAALADPDGTITLDVMYGDHEGGQRFVTRFAIARREGAWTASAGRHWNLDAPQPRER
jgi:hypothetical protein